MRLSRRSIKSTRSRCRPSSTLLSNLNPSSRPEPPNKSKSQPRQRFPQLHRIPPLLALIKKCRSWLLSTEGLVRASLSCWSAFIQRPSKSKFRSASTSGGSHLSPSRPDSRSPRFLRNDRWKSLSSKCESRPPATKTSSSPAETGPAKASARASSQPSISKKSARKSARSSLNRSRS